MKRARALALDQLAEIERDMKVERVAAAAADNEILRVFAECLGRGHELDRYLRLIRSDENDDLDGVPLERREVLRLDVLVVDQNEVVGRHCRLLLAARTGLSRAVDRRSRPL